MPPVVIDIRSAEDARDVVHRAVQALAEGKLVAFPTETVYGLAASALSADAVRSLLAAKGQPLGHPLTLAIRGADEALDYVPEIPPLGLRLARRCWPGPVTLLVEDNSPDSLIRRLPPLVQEAVAPAGSIGLRVPAHATILDVLRLIAGPLAMTGAYRADQSPPEDAQQVVAGLADSVHLVLDDGRTRYGQPSSVVRVDGRGFEIVRPGVVSEQTLKRLASMVVLFVCTGNTCRSPMAEVIFRKQVAARLGCPVNEVQDRGVLVMSAGIAATMGGRPSPEAVEVVKRMGLELADHTTQPLSERLVQQADLIFVMTRSHRQAILSEWPEAAERVRLVCHDRADVSDPIGGPPEQYAKCAEQIETELDKWMNELKF